MKDSHFMSGDCYARSRIERVYWFRGCHFWRQSYEKIRLKIKKAALKFHSCFTFDPFLQLKTMIDLLISSTHTPIIEWNSHFSDLERILCSLLCPTTTFLFVCVFLQRDKKRLKFHEPKCIPWIAQIFCKLEKTGTEARVRVTLKCHKQ